MKNPARRMRTPLPVWYQLVVSSACAEIVPPTRTGIDPFDDDIRGEYRCPLGDTIGLRLLSEVSVNAMSRGGSDIVCTRQFIGGGGGCPPPKAAYPHIAKVLAFAQGRRRKGSICRGRASRLTRRCQGTREPRRHAKGRSRGDEPRRHVQCALIAVREMDDSDAWWAQRRGSKGSEDQRGQEDQRRQEPMKRIKGVREDQRGQEPIKGVREDQRGQEPFY